MKKKVAIIGSGFSGLSAASVLAARGHETIVLEKNLEIGGRARQKIIKGFTFDMGPSWYWMPEIFEKFYNKFGHTASDFYDLKQLDPGFTIIYKGNEHFDIPANFIGLQNLFESIEKGSALRLIKFLEEAEFKYKTGMESLIYQPANSIFEFININTIRGIFRLDIFSSFSTHVRKYFKDPRLIALMEFPILFLGAMPDKTPALYSLMNYAGLRLGTWYPMGGFAKVVDAFHLIANENGVRFYTGEAVTSLQTKNKKIVSIHSGTHNLSVDAIIGAADYHHIEKDLLLPEQKNYSEAYWEKKIFAPSCLIFYIGVNKKIKRLNHHNLFFDEDFTAHAEDIYINKKWPEAPLLYVCCPSKTDSSVAPEGNENLFILMPVASGLKDTPEIRNHYFTILTKRIERYIGENITEHLVVNESYCLNDFEHDYNAYKGNAYGLANTLSQTAFLKPKIRSRKLKNMFFCGQLTVPGPGVPPSIISGEIAAAELLNYFNQNKMTYENKI